MKKTHIAAVAGAAIILAASAIAYKISAEAAQTKTICIPVTVQAGDTLNSICGPLAIKYGDVRVDLREVTYGVQRHNNAWGNIYPGDKLIIPLVVPADGPHAN